MNDIELIVFMITTPAVIGIFVIIREIIKTNREIKEYEEKNKHRG